MGVKLSVHGAAGCVTGSCYRIETEQASVLVDCGMFQGSKSLKELNYGAFAFDPRTIDAVLLTHAHMDHAGLLPKLMLAGFSGPIWATQGTRDLCEVMLADSGHIQQTEVEQLNRRNQHRGRRPVTPIYTVDDARRVMRQFRATQIGETMSPAAGLTARWWNAGHILGSASIEVTVAGDPPVTVFFTGDIGPGGRDFLADPDGPAGVDHLVTESTYGERVRGPITPQSRRALLADEVKAAHALGGPLVMPAFAVERTQELLADLFQIMAEGAAPPAEVFLDSPLAIEVSDIFLRRGGLDADGQNPFEALKCGERLRYVSSPRESDELEERDGWHVVMAASGMCDAGRIRKHLKRQLWRRQATVLLSGFQALGTLGRLLADGEKRVHIQGEEIRVQAKIRQLDVYSGHADAEGLVRQALARRPIAGAVFLCHGEPDARDALTERLVAAGLPRAQIISPAIDQAFALTPDHAEPVGGETRRAAPAQPAALDWHNARARLLSDLETRLEALPDNQARTALIERVRQALEPVH